MYVITKQQERPAWAPFTLNITFKDEVDTVTFTHMLDCAMSGRGLDSDGRGMANRLKAGVQDAT